MKKDETQLQFLKRLQDVYKLLKEEQTLNKSQTSSPPFQDKS